MISRGVRSCCKWRHMNQTIRFMARKKTSFPSLEDLFNDTAESINEVYMKKFGISEGLPAAQKPAALEQKKKYRVLLYPEAHEELRQKSEPVVQFDDELKTLAADLLELMYAEKGIGISAPQIGVFKRVIAINESCTPGSEHERVFVNPKIIKGSKNIDVYEEGCLSFPETLVDVRRRVRIDMKYCDLEGVEKTERITGIQARIIQHELDHLDGILLVDKMGRT